MRLLPSAFLLLLEEEALNMLRMADILRIIPAHDLGVHAVVDGVLERRRHHRSKLVSSSGLLMLSVQLIRMPNGIFVEEALGGGLVEAELAARHLLQARIMPVVQFLRLDLFLLFLRD